MSSSAWTATACPAGLRVVLQDYGRSDRIRLAMEHPERVRALIAQNAVAIIFLELSPFFSGESLHVDGGQIAGH